MNYWREIKKPTSVLRRSSRNNIFVIKKFWKKRPNWRKRKKEGESVISVAPLPILNWTVLREFLVWIYWTIFVQRHQIARFFLQQSIRPAMLCSRDLSSIGRWDHTYHREVAWDSKPRVFALLYHKWLSVEQANCSRLAYATKTKITFQDRVSTFTDVGFEPGFWKKKVRIVEKRCS